MIGDKIKLKRIELKMTQYELAQKVHVYPSHICRWERKKVTPSRMYLKALAKALKVSVDYFTQDA